MWLRTLFLTSAYCASDADAVGRALRVPGAKLWLFGLVSGMLFSLFLFLFSYDAAVWELMKSFCDRKNNLLRRHSCILLMRLSALHSLGERASLRHYRCLPLKKI